MKRKKAKKAKKAYLGIFIFISITLFISLIILNNKQTTISKAQPGSAGSCKNNPEPPPQGYTWVADCNKHCTNNAECSENYDLSDPEWKTKSNWCYGFKGSTGTSDDFRCLMLVSGEVSSNMLTPFANDTYIPLSSAQASGGFFGGGSITASMNTLSSLFSMLFQILGNPLGSSSPTSIPEQTDVSVEPTITSPSNMPIPTITSSPQAPTIEQRGLCQAISPKGLGDCSTIYYIKDGETECRTCSAGIFGEQTGQATCTCPTNQCVCTVQLQLGKQTVNCTPNGILIVDPTIKNCP